MSILIYAEHDNQALKTETHKLVHAAASLGDTITVLIAGSNCAGVADHAAKISGVNNVLLAAMHHLNIN
jgi:electron transfer flavoprotein alpha subunit